MKRILLFLFLFTTVSFSQINWTEITSNYTLPAGIKVFKGERSSPILKIFYIDVDMNNPDLVIHPYIGPNKTINNFIPFVGAYAGINGGFFGGSTSYSAVVYPYEVKAQNVATVTRFSQSYPVIRSFFGMNFDRTFNVEWIYHFGSGVEDIYRFDAPMPYTLNQTTPLPPPEQSAGNVYENLLVGIGGAPTLVKNGQVNVTYNQEIMWGSGVGFDNGDPRTAVGYTADNHVIMIVADGRQASSQGVGLPELAQIMIDLGCIEAMNLDGGGSTQMAVGNQFVNTPSESRAVPTILTVTHKDSLHIPAIPQFEKIIDTGDPEASVIGNDWFPTANPGYWGTTPSLLHSLGSGLNYVEFKPAFPADAEYEIYAWWVASANRCQNTPFIIKHKNGVDTVRVNQVQNGSMWNLIGTFDFSPDTAQKIIISDAGTIGTYVVADAIQIISYDPSTDVNIEDSPLPGEFKLFQNYPNPFNPETKISFYVGEQSKIQLKIFDLLGNEVRNILNEEKSPGFYSVRFNGSGLPSGVYFCRLISADFYDTKKLILLK
ncbi:MAG: phosphodiester glycosidase family protein [Ignavibacteriaceae bacterium]|nr:phosphodiester glycosidase family protein [Ignavibacteriaceae bacterium]